MSKKRTMTADDLAHEAELNEQIVRMREMLRLMAPETGAVALGAIRKAFPDVPLAKRVLALRDYR